MIKASQVFLTGANDVPKYGGGLYWPCLEDERDYIKGFDSNERLKNELVLNIMKKIRGITNDDNNETLLAEGRRVLKDTGILDITEYGRAVHAEMEALLSAARNGIETKKTSLYTTTYPCHNCAKHIVAAGVEEVIYIEPYPKSFASKLHDDAIDTEGNGDNSSKVKFVPFVGIGPRKFVDLFSMSIGSGRKLTRKFKGDLKQWDRNSAELRVPMTPLSYLEAEAILVGELAEFMQNGDKDE